MAVCGIQVNEFCFVFQSPGAPLAVKLPHSLYSECERVVYLIELMIPFEDAMEEVFIRKKLNW